MVQHQPRHDFLEFFGLKDDVELRDRVRAYRLIAEGAGLTVNFSMIVSRKPSAIFRVSAL
jgi:hypothetical protein